MEAQPKKFCPAVWFSGFFGLGALVHFIRLVLRMPLTVGTFEIPLGLSLVLVIVFGGLSLGLFYVGVRRPCCKRE